MVLARINGRGYVHVGSLNGGEASNKVNREVALQVQSDAAYAYLAGMFEQDWAMTVSSVYLPLLMEPGKWAVENGEWKKGTKEQGDRGWKMEHGESKRKNGKK